MTDELLYKQFQTLKAELGIISLNFLCAMTSFAMFSDIQNEFLSPLFIGSVVLIIIIACKLTIRSETADNIFIYVDNEKDKRTLNRCSIIKRIIFFFIWMTYIIVITNIVTPMIYQHGQFEWVVTPASMIFIPAFAIILIFIKDKRIKYSDAPLPSIEERDANPKGIVNLIPNYRYADEQQKMVITKAYASVFKWIMAGLSIITIVDLVVELVMQQLPIGGMITLAFLVITLVIYVANAKKLKTLLKEY
ncbi:hypothetical protein BUY43_06795 [Staphylococcus devriesei]|uniref:DUF3278 domain-containing protein n=1 Tax=Staphylococcus devriesei TaxID=586733 RepID=A0A2T4KGA4_9STAP|nr:hypothetical protein [Staphylococcus devriesei]PTE72167.1 hypothetical protein BUY44_08505 [Staphylococcus devriesei]RIL73666.1 hypothetical protein BUY43_06795 [Staphylococcus devriesei]WKU14148.1 hypothetical protein Q2T90_04265 [Staphylococcus devriesei]